METVQIKLIVETGFKFTRDNVCLAKPVFIDQVMWHSALQNDKRLNMYSHDEIEYLGCYNITND